MKNDPGRAAHLRRQAVHDAVNRAARGETIEAEIAGVRYILSPGLPDEEEFYLVTDRAYAVVVGKRILVSRLDYKDTGNAKLWDEPWCSMRVRPRDVRCRATPA